jgi:hypothetical protein
VGETSIAPPPSGELARQDISDTPIATAAPASVPAQALTVLIAVPTMESGAADEGAVELARILGAAGHRAIIATSGGRLEPEVAACGAEVMRLDTASRNPLVMARNAFALKRLIVERRCTLIHALARAPVWSALAAARMTGVPLVTTWYNGFRD